MPLVVALWVTAELRLELASHQLRGIKLDFSRPREPTDTSIVVHVVACRLLFHAGCKGEPRRLPGKLAKLGEETLDQVEPRAALRCKDDLEAALGWAAKHALLENAATIMVIVNRQS
jgi:hypothetical protein